MKPLFLHRQKIRDRSTSILPSSYLGSGRFKGEGSGN
jgi:hypothetical protein